MGPSGAHARMRMRPRACLRMATHPCMRRLEGGAPLRMHAWPRMPRMGEGGALRMRCMRWSCCTTLHARIHACIAVHRACPHAMSGPARCPCIYVLACMHPPAGEKLSETSAPDVRALCTTLLNAYLIQLLDTGLLHADPHPGARAARRAVAPPGSLARSVATCHGACSGCLLSVQAQQIFAWHRRPQE